MYETARIRPSWLHCFWGAPFLVVGGGLFVYTLVHGLVHTTDSLTQVVVPGKAELYLQRNRTYTVFLEEQSTVDGKIYSTTQSIAGLECRVNSARDGSAVAVTAPGASTTYEVNGRSGHSVLEFFIQQDGTYVLACDYAQNNSGPEVVVAVGSGVGAAIYRTVLGCLAEGFGGAAACLIVVFTVLLMRERAKKKLRQAGQTPITPRAHF